MRRIAMSGRSIDLLRARAASQTPYLCSACKHRAAPFSTSSLRAARQKIPFTEKVRQRIWGTDKPPGQADPYGDRSVFDKSKERAKEEEEREQNEGRIAQREASRPVSYRKQKPDLSTYEPATTWEGLEKVGGFGGWWKENWDPENQYRGFLPAEVMTDPSAVTAALHRAIVEVYALQQAGQSVQSVSAPPGMRDFTQGVQITPSATGATLQFAGESSLEDVIQSLAPAIEDETAVKEDPTESEEDVAADRSTIDPLHPDSEPATTGQPTESEEDVAADRSATDPLQADETSTHENPTEAEEDVAADRSEVDPLADAPAQVAYTELVASWDPSWLQVSLENPEIKFAVVKRTMQLTGLRISDSAIKPARTAQALLAHLVRPPKPRKLVDALQQKEDLINLPNVTVSATRITPIDKHKSVGRWKVIEQELIERELPVTGHEARTSRRIMG